ncbi:hypothetical protein ILUMI_18092 [Ignelater luminosus]|uniref:CCHC-type domain-containing protein n=1 Tax=Ignelater luminosus TaxID=2038154 RepID=A0A8K0CM13_IGNLU|nr:hypothetical protein ILUMI_18092 [Ignelater luminosus]
MWQSNVKLQARLPRMLLYLITVISLFVREGYVQECHYNVVYRQNVTVCTNITTHEQLRNQVNETLSPYGNITWIIDRLILVDCDMLNLTINELRFLSQLKEVHIWNSNINTLSFENPDETVYDSDATEKIRNHALEMLGMIRFLKMEYAKTVRELIEFQNNKNLKDKVVEKVEKVIIREEMNYANAVVKKPETTFAVKISAEDTKNVGKVEQLLKTNVQPSKLNIIILQNIDKNLDKTNLIETICKNNRDLVESCGGIDQFHKQVKKKFRLGGRDKDKCVSVVLDVTSEARKEFLKRRIILEWESVYAKDYISLVQCFKCYRFRHKSDKCKESAQICGKCGHTGHDFKNCKSNDTKCIVCVRANEKGCKIDQVARDKKCPTMLKIKEKIIKSIDYGQ